MTDIELRPFERKDFSRLIAWVKSPEFLLQWAGPIFDFPLDLIQLEIYLRGAEEEPPTRNIYKAIRPRDNAVIGHVELANIDRRNKSATLCRVLIGEPPLRGTGLGIEMVRRALDVGFSELGLHRIDLVVFDFNTAAIRCYERAGFMREGQLREARKIGGEYWTLNQMSILEQEWRIQQASSHGVRIR